jgi:hypothetical protein
LCEDGELIALLALAEYYVAIAEFFKLKRYFSEYRCYVVFAHTLKIRQAQK